MYDHVEAMLHYHEVDPNTLLPFCSWRDRPSRLAELSAAGAESKSGEENWLKMKIGL